MADENFDSSGNVTADELRLLIEGPSGWKKRRRAFRTTSRTSSPKPRHGAIDPKAIKKIMQIRKKSAKNIRKRKPSSKCI